MKRYAMYLLIATLGLGSGVSLNAGDAGQIEGKIGAPKPTEAVVYVEKVPGTYEAQKAKLDQKNKVFLPHVLPILKGSAVEFHNSDTLQHNVFGVGDDEFDLGNWNAGVVREHTFNKTGEVTLLCNVHPEMEATVLVLDNPYFTQPASDGTYRITGLPAGEYVVKAWYRGKTKKKKVQVTAGESVSVNF